MPCSLAGFCAPFGLRVTETGPADLVDLRDLIFAIFTEYGFPQSRHWYDEDPWLLARESLVGVDRGFSHLLRAKNGMLAGVGILIPRLDRDVASLGEISHFYLRPEWRGQGLGRAMLDDLIMHAADLRYRSLYLVTRVELTAARRLYERNGFGRIANERYAGKPHLIEMRLAF